VYVEMDLTVYQHGPNGFPGGGVRARAGGAGAGGNIHTGEWPGRRGESMAGWDTDSEASECGASRAPGAY